MFVFGPSKNSFFLLPRRKLFRVGKGNACTNRLFETRFCPPILLARGATCSRKRVSPPPFTLSSPQGCPPQRPSKGYFRLSTYSECPYSICIAKQAKSTPEGTKVVFAKRKNTSAHKCHCPIFRLDTRAKSFFFCELNNFFFFFFRRSFSSCETGRIRG